MVKVAPSLLSANFACLKDDIEKIEKNVIRAKIGSQTSNNTTVNNNVSKAAELAMLINSGKYPVDYKVQNNRFVYSDITHTQLIYAALVVAALIIIVFIIFIVKYLQKIIFLIKLT